MISAHENTRLLVAENRNGELFVASFVIVGWLHVKDTSAVPITACPTPPGPRAIHHAAGWATDLRQNRVYLTVEEWMDSLMAPGVFDVAPGETGDLMEELFGPTPDKPPRKRRTKLEMAAARAEDVRRANEGPV